MSLKNLALTETTPHFTLATMVWRWRGKGTEQRPFGNQMQHRAEKCLALRLDASVAGTGGNIGGHG